MNVENLIVKNEAQFSLIKLNRYHQLWQISFYKCPALPLTLLESLSTISCLGFFDISYSKIDLKALQSSIRSIAILRLHCFGCSFSVNWHQTRGFLIYTLPNVWSLNGIMSTCEDRYHYEEYYKHGQGRYSELHRKQFVRFDPKYVPSRLFNTKSDQTNECSIISCQFAKSHILPIPLEFKMEADRDIWRLMKLSLELERLVTLLDHPVLNSSLSSFINQRSTASNDCIENSTIGRSILLLLILGSFMEDFMNELSVLQFALITLFDHKEWTCPPFSPLNWKLQHRLFYCSLLIARLSIPSPLGNSYLNLLIK